MKFTTSLKNIFSKTKPDKPLPKVPATPPPSLSSNTSSNAPSQRPLNILVVDDASINRYILNQYITKVEPTAIIYESGGGRDSIEKCDTYDIDLIFMDIRMPEIDGLEATNIILKKHPKIMVAGCTGQVEESMTKKCIKSGMFKCIGKPISMEDIKRIIDSVKN